MRLLYPLFFAALLGPAFATDPPTAADFEVGTNDLRISDLGPDGNGAYDAFVPAIAYNGVQDQYLVVWEGDDDSDGLANDEIEIFGQLLTGVTGLPTGVNDVRMSFAGGTGDPGYDAYTPDVAFDGIDFQYLIVWSQDSDEGALVNNEFEIWGRIVDRFLNPLYGGNFRISTMGPDGVTAYGAHAPAVAFNPFRFEYLVVWSGDDDTGDLVSGELEIWAQRVSATGGLVGSRVRVSDMGDDGVAAYDAFTPDVVFNTAEGEYLVVWSGDDDTGSLINEEFEIYGQRLDELGAEIGGDYKLSDMGGTANASYGAWTPAVAYNPGENQYLVAWQGDDYVDGLVDGEYEIFAQRLNYWLGTLGGNDVRLSDAGGIGNAEYQVQWGPDVAFNTFDESYLVVWASEDTVDGMVANEWEVFAQRLTWDGLEVAPNDERISDAGGLGSTSYFTYDPVVAANTASGQFLAAWSGSDNVGGVVAGEFEIFTQRLVGPLFADDFEIGDTSGWSSTVP